MSKQPRTPYECIPNNRIETVPITSIYKKCVAYFNAHSDGSLVAFYEETDEVVADWLQNAYKFDTFLRMARFYRELIYGPKDVDLYVSFVRHLLDPLIAQASASLLLLKSIHQILPGKNTWLTNHTTDISTPKHMVPCEASKLRYSSLIYEGQVKETIKTLRTNAADSQSTSIPVMEVAANQQIKIGDTLYEFQAPNPSADLCSKTIDHLRFLVTFSTFSEQLRGTLGFDRQLHELMDSFTLVGFKQVPEEVAYRSMRVSVKYDVKAVKDLDPANFEAFKEHQDLSWSRSEDEENRYDDELPPNACITVKKGDDEAEFFAPVFANFENIVTKVESWMKTSTVDLHTVRKACHDIGEIESFANTDYSCRRIYDWHDLRANARCDSDVQQVDGPLSFRVTADYPDPSPPPPSPPPRQPRAAHPPASDQAAAVPGSDDPQVRRRYPRRPPH